MRDMLICLAVMAWAGALLLLLAWAGERRWRIVYPVLFVAVTVGVLARGADSHDHAKRARCEQTLGGEWVELYRSAVCLKKGTVLR